MAPGVCPHISVGTFFKRSGSDTGFFLAVLGVIFVNIIIRFPVVPHEIGIDSFFIHYLGGVIASEGSIPWLLSPLSLFGVYPYSYPSGIPILLAVLHCFTGLEMEWIIYGFALCMGLLGIGTSYLLAGEFFQSRGLQLLFAFVFSLSPLALKFTIWTASTRGAFLMLLPLALWSLIRFCKEKSFVYLLVTISLYILLWSVHRLFILLIPITFLCMVLYLGKTHISPEKQQKHPAVFVGILFGAILLSVSIYILQFIELAELYQYSDTYWGLRYFSFLSLPVWVNYLVGNVIEIGARFVLLLPLAAAGLISFMRKEVVSVNEWFIICTTLFFLPFLGYSIQIYQILLPFICLLAVYGIVFLIKERRTQVAKVIVSLFILLLLLFSSLGTLIIRDTGADSSGFHNYAEEETVSVAEFLQEKVTIPGEIEGSLSLFIAAYSGRWAPMPEDLSCLIGDTADNDPIIEIKQVNLFNPHSWEGFVKYPFLVKERIACTYEAEYLIAGSGCCNAVPAETYQIYDNGLHTVRYNHW
ncbi:MAG: hypothetical protein JXA44_06215 [Methanospirillaceae archaeon]|nr:hypothetical protein [Methanospirillaceae archaeon]